MSSGLPQGLGEGSLAKTAPAIPQEAAYVADWLYRAGARAVWLFGSAARRGGDSASDLDVAVEGLNPDPGLFPRIHRHLSGRVDIVRLESAPPALRNQILRCRRIIPKGLSERPTERSTPALPATLHGVRTSAVARHVRSTGHRSLIDFGCGSGLLLAELAADRAINRLCGVDFSAASLRAASRRIAKATGRFLAHGPTITLVETLITYRDPRFEGYEAATAIEVIEHLDPRQLEAFISMLFGFARPDHAFVTTPNADYNVRWFEDATRRRHHDHRFEWSRSEFQSWSAKVATAYGYECEMHALGNEDPRHGAPSQLAVFRRIRD